MKPTLFAGVLLGTLSASPVFASTINTTDMMASFNVITLGALAASSETEGTVYVGGSLTTTGYGVNNDRLKEGTVGGITGSLIVGGSVTGSINVQIGAVRIGGTNTATINQNGTGSVQSGVSGIPTGDVTAAFRKLSTDLAARSDTPGAEARADDENDLTVISGTGGSDGVAVVRGSSALVSTGTFKGVQTSTGSRADIPTIVNTRRNRQDRRELQRNAVKRAVQLLRGNHPRYRQGVQLLDPRAFCFGHINRRRHQWRDRRRLAHAAERIPADRR